MPLSILGLANLTFAIITLWLQSRQKVRAWPLTIIKKTLSIAFFYQKALYIKCLLDTLLIANSCHAWIKWGEGKLAINLQVTTLGLYRFISLILTSALLGILIGYLFTTYTTSQLSYLDALHATLTIATYSLLARKKLEAWILSLIANAIYLPVCWEMNTIFMMIKYITYIAISINGYNKWKTEYHNTNPHLKNTN